MRLFTILVLFLSPLVSFARSTNCTNPEMFHALDQLTQIDRIHNCSIEFAKVTSNDNIVFLGYAKDLTPTSGSISPELTFSFSFEAACETANHDYQYKTLRKSFGFNSPISDFRVAIYFDFSNSPLPRRMVMQKIDLLDHQVVERINCGKIAGL